MKENTIFKVKKKRLFDSLVDYVSFSQEVRRLVEVLNTEIAAPETVKFRPISHPAGFVRLITKRRLTIAEAYIKLISHSHSDSYVERIEALQVLMHHVWHAKNLSMPLNTARVQIALMKNAVKMRGNRRAQLELMSDFARASYGQASVIRRLLRELDLLEVPETGDDLSQLQLGWDDHVHDSMTEGRKSPTQLVLDAFIKGMSRITVAYYDVAGRQTYEEIFHAGRILGIRVQIGIEFSVGLKCHRLHYLYIPPQDWEFEKLNSFLNDKAEELRPFLDGLQENAVRRHATVNSLLDNFNKTGLEVFNESFMELKALQMQPLSWESIETVTAKGQANRIHLGQLIYQSMRPVALKRVLYLKNQYRTLKARAENDPSSSWEADRCFRRYEDARHVYEELTPSLCAEKYIAPQKQLDYDSAFTSENEVLPLLKKTGGYIVFIHPLSQGTQRGIDVLFQNYAYITDIEIFNLVDAIQRDTSEIRRFAQLITALINGNPDQIEILFREWRLAPKSHKEIQTIIDYIKENPFYMRCASDAVGWSSNIPGMGFIHEDSLTPKALKLLKKNNHSMVPQPVAELLRIQHGLSQNEKSAVYLLSSTQIVQTTMNKEDTQPMTPLRFWRYLNVNIRSLILAILGFIPTYYCLAYILDSNWLGLCYAIIWFVLTGFRNAIVDVIAASGITPSAWEIKNIDRENLCASEFFSGLSVPVLAFAKFAFDQTWGAFTIGGQTWGTYDLTAESGFWFTFIKFWTIAFTNGLYLVLHNTLRGFEKNAIRGNFFRNVFSWPIATAGSYFLTPLGVPDIVQAKIWSEVVAGFIEGTVKNAKQNKLAQKALFEVYRQILSPNPLYALIARLDILFFWGKYSKGRRSLQKFLRIANKDVSGISDAQKRDIQKANMIIFDAFTTEGALESLTYAILEYYPEENLTILTDFAGETHEPFVQWLNRNKDAIIGNATA